MSRRPTRAVLLPISSKASIKNAPILVSFLSYASRRVPLIRATPPLDQEKRNNGGFYLLIVAPFFLGLPLCFSAPAIPYTHKTPHQTLPSPRHLHPSTLSLYLYRSPRR